MYGRWLLPLAFGILILTPTAGMARNIIARGVPAMPAPYLGPTYGTTILTPFGNIYQSGSVFTGPTYLAPAYSYSYYPYAYGPYYSYTYGSAYPYAYGSFYPAYPPPAGLTDSGSAAAPAAGGPVPANPAPVTITPLSSKPAPTTGVVEIDIHVPAGAELWIEGGRTSQQGTLRRFVSPALPLGQSFRYQLRVRWKENGRDLEETQTLTVQAGDRKTVSFPGAAPMAR